MLEDVAADTAETGACGVGVSSAEDIDEGALTSIDVVAADALSANLTGDDIAVRNVDISCHDASRTCQHIAGIAIFAESVGHITGLA